jgi:hypothetical protein
MAFFPFVTWVMMDFSERPPARYWSRASFSRVFSGMITFCPPAWHAAQLALKICSPAPTSAAKAGAASPKAIAPTVAACAEIREEILVCKKSRVSKVQEQSDGQEGLSKSQRQIDLLASGSTSNMIELN